MADFRARWAKAWRAYCDKHANQTVLVLGDSHVRVFEHWWFMWALPRVRWDVAYVPGGTPTGLYNKHSLTQTYAHLVARLEACQGGQVVLNLGEVDTGYGIWVRAERYQKDPYDLLKVAANNYERLIRDWATKCRLVVLSAPLPTLPDTFVPGEDVLSRRNALGRSQLERTALTLAFNDQTALLCNDLGVPFLDDRSDSLGEGGLVQPHWVKSESPDHHYHRKTYARWLAARLKPLLKP